MKKIFVLLAIVVSVFAMSACTYGNRSRSSEMLLKNNVLNYVLIDECGIVFLHEIDKWSDSESESFTVSTKCCRNYIWASANNATFYREKPSHWYMGLTYVYEDCAGLGD